MNLGRLERRREMRTVKSSAFLSGLCAFAVALGLWLAGLARGHLAAAASVNLLLAVFWVIWLRGTREKLDGDV